MIFPPYKKIQQHSQGRLFAIGDIHGCLDQLKALLNKIEFNSEVDQIIFVGDLIDRGPYSIETLEFLLDKPYFHIVAGNHEHLMYEHIKGTVALAPDMLEFWQKHEGGWVSQLNDRQTNNIANKLSQQCHYIIEAQCNNGHRFGLTHAGYETEHWFDSNQEYDYRFFHNLMWSRQCAESTPGTLPVVSGIDHTVHGHTIFKDSYCNGNAIFIDTGCASGGKLTALDLERFSSDKAFNDNNLFIVNGTEQV